MGSQIEPNHLHLLRLVPLAWLSADRLTTFERIPTEFGPVTLQFRLQKNASRLLVTFQPHFRHNPRSVSLHVPPLEGLADIAIGGQVYTVRQGDVVTLIEPCMANDRGRRAGARNLPASRWSAGTIGYAGINK